MKLYGDFFWTRSDPVRFRRRPEDLSENDKLTGRTLGGPGLLAHRGTSKPNSSSINTQLLPVDHRAHQKILFRRRKLLFS